MTLLELLAEIRGRCEKKNFILQNPTRFPVSSHGGREKKPRVLEDSNTGFSILAKPFINSSVVSLLRSKLEALGDFSLLYSRSGRGRVALFVPDTR